MLLALRINVLAKGYSGISLETLHRMIQAFNGKLLNPDFHLSLTSGVAYISLVPLVLLVLLVPLVILVPLVPLVLLVLFV